MYINKPGGPRWQRLSELAGLVNKNKIKLEIVLGSRLTGPQPPAVELDGIVYNFDEGLKLLEMLVE